tara:strand:+ start:57 stop:206 length:150 start_codon:yes stop_codon:yes gene_type:complete
MNAIEFVNRMDELAEEMFGEFGYDTCHPTEKAMIVAQLIKANDIINGNK